jgi:hypothetical protein
MVIKAIILSTLLSSEPAILPASPIKVEARKRNGKGNKGRRRGGSGLR